MEHLLVHLFLILICVDCVLLILLFNCFILVRWIDFRLALEGENDHISLDEARQVEGGRDDGGNDDDGESSFVSL